MEIARHQIFKCEYCGNVVEITSVGGGELVCCAHPMKLMLENTSDGAVEKHVPVIEANPNGGCIVKIGATPHPMTSDHFIEWVEIINGPYVNRKYLKAGDLPQAEFYLPKKETLYIRAYCNKHGLWKK